MRLRAQHVQRLVDHARGVHLLGARVDQLAGDDGDDLVVDALQLRAALLLAHLHLALFEDLEDDVIDRGILAEGLLEVGRRRRLALGHVQKDVGDLQDVVEIGLDAGAPFEHFVLVAGDLEPLLALFESDEGDVGQFDLVGGLLDRHFGGGCVVVAKEYGLVSSAVSILREMELLGMDSKVVTIGYIGCLNSFLKQLLCFKKSGIQVDFLEFL